MILDKTDRKLGEEVNQYLKDLGIQTPMMVQHPLSNTDPVELQKTIERHVKGIMECLGLDLSDDSLIETPKRVAKMYLHELFWGLQDRNFPKCTTVENKMGYDEMVMEKNITVMSACEHHLVTIDGLAHVAYIPDKKVLGLSKINRIVEYFSARPQIQERLTEQIFAALCYILETENVAVVIDATHYCVKSRGVRDYNSSTVTSKLGGAFRKDASLRKEFLDLIPKRSDR